MFWEILKKWMPALWKSTLPLHFLIGQTMEKNCSVWSLIRCLIIGNIHGKLHSNCCMLHFSHILTDGSLTPYYVTSRVERPSLGASAVQLIRILQCFCFWPSADVDNTARISSQAIQNGCGQLEVISMGSIGHCHCSLSLASQNWPPLMNPTFGPMSPKIDPMSLRIRSMNTKTILTS